MIFIAVRPADHDGQTLAHRTAEDLRSQLAAGWEFIGFVSIAAELAWREARNAFLLGLEKTAIANKRAADAGTYGARTAWERACGQVNVEIDKLTRTEGIEYGAYRISA